MDFFYTLQKYFRTTIKPKNSRATNLQANTKANGTDVIVHSEAKSSAKLSTRTSLLPPNSANNIRTRPATTVRPIQPYRGAQTSVNTTAAKAPVASASVPRDAKKPINDFGSTYSSKNFASDGNGLLNDVSNRPLTAPVRSQVGPQRRTILPNSFTERMRPSSSMDLTTARKTIIPRSSSSTLTQSRKNGIPTNGVPQQKTSATTVTR